MNENTGKMAFGIGVALFMICVVGGCAGCTTVPAGHVGVVTTFGEVTPQPLPSGLHLIAPWRSVHRLSVQTKEQKETVNAPTREGLTVHLEASLLYSLEGDKASGMFKDVGDKYDEVVVFPQFRSALRGATSHYEAKDLYTASREKIEEDLAKSVRTSLGLRGVLVEQVLLRDVQLPPMVKERVEAKLAAEQDAQRMQFVLQKTTQEAEQKRVEAKGLADAQAIIKKELSHEYLIYMWIKSLEENSKHGNTTVYIPTGSDGMPFFKTVGPGGK
jgi:regulator of protease activity HflC (stomatin/prohibitin superfamily)